MFSSCFKVTLNSCAHAHSISHEYNYSCIVANSTCISRVLVRQILQMAITVKLFPHAGQVVQSLVEGQRL